MRHSKIKKIESGNFRNGGPSPFGYSSFILDQKLIIESIFTQFNEGIPIIGIVKRLKDKKIPTPNPIYIVHVIYQKKFVKDTLNQKLVINNG